MEGSASGSASSKTPRPEDLGIKTFVPSKPLPVPTPSREATLTQKLEQALGIPCLVVSTVMSGLLFARVRIVDYVPRL